MGVPLQTRLAEIDRDGGGVTMNVILGIVIYSFILLHYDKTYIANKDVTDGIYAFELGEKVGLQTGDKIIAIDGKPVERFKDVLSEKVILGCQLTVDRGGRMMTITIPDDFYRDVIKTGKGMFIGTRQAGLIVDSVIPGQPAEIAGLHHGDKIIVVDGKRTASAAGLIRMVKENKGRPITMNIVRGADTLLLQPVVNDTGAIGISFGEIDPGKYPLTPYSFGSALTMGGSDAFRQSLQILKD